MIQKILVNSPRKIFFVKKELLEFIKICMVK